MAGKLLSGDALDASSLAVSIRDLEGAFVRVNGPFAALVGLGVEELRGSTATAVFPSDVAAEVRLHDGLALSSPGVVSIEEWVVDRVGRRRVATSRFAVRDKHGRARAVCCVSSAAGHERLVLRECERLFELDGGATATTDPDPDPEGAAAVAALTDRAAASDAARAAAEQQLAEADAARADLEQRLAAAGTADASVEHRAAAAEQQLAAHADELAVLEMRVAAQAAAALAAIRRADERGAQADDAVAGRDHAAAQRDAAVADRDIARAQLAAANRKLAALEADRDQFAAALAGERAARASAEAAADRLRDGNAGDLAEQLAAATATADHLRGLLAARAAVPAAGAPPADGVVPALRGISQTLAGAEDFETAVRDAVGPLGHHLGWDAAFVWRQERPDAPLTCIAAWTDPDLDLARFETASWQSAVSHSSGPHAAAFEDAEAGWIEDIRERQDCPRLRAALAAGLHRSALAPIAGPDGVDGVLEVLALHAGPVDAGRLDALSTAGAMLGDLGHLLARVYEPRWSVGRH